MSDMMPTECIKQKFIRHFISLALNFWSGASGGTAWLLSLGFLGCLIINMLLAIAVNRWNKYFFDAVQHQDLEAVKWSIVFIISLSASTAIASGALIQTRLRLQLHWREWLTGTLVSRWLENRRFQKLSILRSIDNPEARIADDGRLSIELLVDLAGGVINTLLVSASFIAVLWYVGGSVTLAGVTIPGYLVIAVMVYTATTSFGMYRLAWPLVARVEEKAAGEGDFRYDLTRTRENAEAIALIGGQEDQRKKLARSFEALANRWIAVIGRQTQMMFLTSGSNVIAPAVPLLLGAPKFLAGNMTLGDLMQAAAAFWQVYVALNWLADNALSLANWSASARRVAALDLEYRELDKLAS